MRAADAVASILRWKDRDVVGKALSRPARLEVADDLTFTLAPRDPFGLVLEGALSKPTANALFVMPEALARTPASLTVCKSRTPID